MADFYIRELEEKVAHYEEIMSRCPRCKITLPIPETESTTKSSRDSRSSRSAQQSAAEIPPPALTSPSKRPAPASTLSSSARSSKQLHPASRTEQQVSDLQQCTASKPPTASSNRLHNTTETLISTLRHPSINSSDHPTTRSVRSSAVDSSGQPTIASQTQSTRPSSLGLSTAEGRHPYSGELVALDLQQYKKPRSQTRLGRPPGESPRHAEWMRTANIMLEEVPSGRRWREEVQRMDSSIIAAVAMGSTPVSEADVSPIEDVERKELIRLVRRFAERHSEGRVNFEQFILVCLCNVLSSQGVSQGKIVETLQICISDTGKRNIDRYLKGATWVNKMMNELFITDWGYRAVDLIAIWNRSVSTYGTFGDAPDSRQYFITHLTQWEYFEGYQEVPGRRHDTIPWIVKKELGDEVSYRDISESLGYSDDYILKTKSLHSSQPPSPNMDSSPSADGGVARGKHLYRTGERLANHTSSHRQQMPANSPPDRSPAISLNFSEASMLRRQLLQNDSPEDSSGRQDPSTSQVAASQGAKRVIPDRSAKPLGHPDVVGQRRKPYENPNLAELPVSTSLGESAPGTQSTKRPLPESPTSASQATNTTRRRQHPTERSGREEMGPPPQPGNKGLKNQRDRP